MYTGILPKKSVFANFKAYLDKNIFYTILIMAGGVYMQTKPNILITPIFDQSAGTVWFDFLRIETLCHQNYGYKVNKETKIDIYNRNVNEWEKQKYTFAFGAYDGNKMVGFASGYREDQQEMYLHNLYVMPEYKGRGIGTALLEQCEHNARLVTDYMTVVSLNEALGFYEKCGYSIYDKRNCEKKLQKDSIGIIPVFKSIDYFHDVDIGLDGDITELKQCKNLPMFAYTSLGRRIDAVALRSLTGENKIWTNSKKYGMKDFYEKKLLGALEKVR